MSPFSQVVPSPSVQQLAGEDSRWRATAPSAASHPVPIPGLCALDDAEHGAGRAGPRRRSTRLGRGLPIALADTSHLCPWRHRASGLHPRRRSPTCTRCRWSPRRSGSGHASSTSSMSGPAKLRPVSRGHRPSVGPVYFVGFSRFRGIAQMLGKSPEAWRERPGRGARFLLSVLDRQREPHGPLHPLAALVLSSSASPAGQHLIDATSPSRVI